MDKLIYKEGFWKSTDKPNYPLPMVKRKSWKGKKKFLRNLYHLQAILEELQYGKISHYRGCSVCRICGISNGNKEYYYENWKWPEGFAHYVEKHNVRPSLAFEAFVSYYNKYFKI